MYREIEEKIRKYGHGPNEISLATAFIWRESPSINLNRDPTVSPSLSTYKLIIPFHRLVPYLKKKKILYDEIYLHGVTQKVLLHRIKL